MYMAASYISDVTQISTQNGSGGTDFATFHCQFVCFFQNKKAFN